jgi:glycosyltransferase involved in cell wall biosynthesis
MLTDMIKALWLTSWYPTQLDEWNGDFIQRHARAVSLYCNVEVIHAEADTQDLLSDPVSIKKNSEGNLTENIVLFKPSHVRLAGKFISLLRYKKFFKKEVKNYIEKNGLPDIVHVHVPMKAGIIALWLKKKYKTPYVVTEHWTIYHSNDDDAYETRSYFFRKFTKNIFTHSKLFLPVSKNLGELISGTVTPVPYKVVYNAVDTKYFHYKPLEENNLFTFIHASTLGEQKNPQAIIEAFLSFHEIHPSSKLLIAGEVHGELFDYILQHRLSQNAIQFTGLVSYREVAQLMQQSNAFVLFSGYENMPCAVLEALCCGLPVITSNVGGLAEVINSNNGIIVPAYKKEALLKAMIDLHNSYPDYDKQKISSDATAKFSYEVIGKEIQNIYKEIL